MYSEATVNRICYNQPLNVQCEKIGDKDQFNASGPLEKWSYQ